MESKVNRLKKFIRKAQDGATLTMQGLTPEQQVEYNKIKMRREKAQSIGAALTGVNLDSSVIGDDDGQITKNGAIALGGASRLVAAGADIADQALIGDKNFSGASKMVDGAVDTVSAGLMSSGNPFAMAAGAALKVGNFISKAGGQTVEGYNANIQGTGYGANLGSMQSESSRGLFGINNSGLRKKLEKRNAQIKMALNAADLADDQIFQQEARANNVQNVIQNNQIALSGGLQTNLLGL